MAVNVRAWQAAYDHILPDEVLSGMSVPHEEYLREREPDPLAEDFPGEFLVAVDEGFDHPSAPPEPLDEAAPDPMDGVVGFAAVHWGHLETFVPDGGAELRAIYVLPSLWGEGIGTRLLDRTVECIPDGYDPLALQVFSANEPSRTFYEARGFAATGESTYEVAGETYPTTVYERPLDGR